MSADMKEEFGLEKNVDKSEVKEIEDIKANEIGALKMASVRAVMNRWELWVCYIGLLLITFVVSLEVNLSYGLLPIALEEYKANALTSVISVVISLTGVILVPLFSQFSDYFGRTELFLTSLFIHFLGLLITIFAPGFPAFSVGWIITNIGSTGYEIIKAIFMADLTSLANRALLNAADMIPFVLNNWIGALSATPIIENLGWRWGYIIPTILLVPCSLLFFIMIFRLQYKVKKNNTNAVSIKSFGIKTTLFKIYNEIDLIGLLLLIISSSFIMLPLIVSGTLAEGWNTPSMIILEVLGGLLLILLIVWESRYAKYPLIPTRLLKNKTTLGAILIGFFIKMDAGLNWQYFMLYFMISRKIDSTQALLLFKGNQMGYLVSVLISALIMKKISNYKYILIPGTIINCIGLGTMIPARFPHSSDVLIHVTQAISGIGQGMVDMSIVIGYQGSASRKNVAIVTAAAKVLAGIGTAIGNTIAGAIWTQVIPQFLAERVKGDIDLARTMNEITYVQTLPESQFEDVISAFGDAQMIISAISCALAGLSFFFAVFMMKNIDLHNTQKFDANIEEENEKVE